MNLLPMLYPMVEIGPTLVGAAFGFLFATVVDYFRTTRLVSSQKEQLELQINATNQRQVSEKYIEQKVSNLMHLHYVLQNTFRLYKKKADKVPHSAVTREDIEEALDQYEECSVAIDQASIFLSESQQQKLYNFKDFLGFVETNLNNALNHPKQTEQYDFGKYELIDFIETFEDAEQMLKNEIKPRIDVLEMSSLDAES